MIGSERDASSPTRGLTFGIDIVNITQSVVDGGFDQDTENDGSLYLEAHFDSQKAGLWPGGFADFRAEKSYGDSVNRETGTMLGSNMVGLFPDGDDKTMVVSKLMFTQFLAKWAGVFIGRTDTADGEAITSPSGRGRTQFMSARWPSFLSRRSRRPTWSTASAPSSSPRHWPRGSRECSSSSSATRK